MKILPHTLHLHRPNGTLAATYQVVKETFAPEEGAKVAPRTKHHILIVDRSGSMYSSMQGMQDMICKVKALQEYHNQGMLWTLISYSSMGDCTVHFLRKAVEDVSDKDIRAIRVTGLTCISQALEKALSLVDDTEATLVTLHSDGYANDRSPYTEHKTIERLLEGAARPSLSIHTIAYSHWSDFAFLDNIATRGGGKSTFARDLQAVYSALEDSVKTLNTFSGSAPVVEREDDDIVVVYDHASHRVLASTEDKIFLHGVQSGAAIFRLKKDPKATGPDLSTNEKLALARGFLGLGMVPQAKQIVVSSKVMGLFPHMRALLPAEVGAFAQDLEALLLNGYTGRMAKTAAVPSSGATVLEIMQALRAHRQHVLVHMPTLKSGYRRMTVQRVAGTRAEDGSVTPFEYDSEGTDKSDWQRLGAVEVSTDHPNLNIRIDRPAALVRRASREVIQEVAGVKLTGQLFLYNNYTVISDGRICVPHLKIKVSSKALWARLHDLGVVAEEYSPTEAVDIDLSSRFIVDDMGEMPEMSAEVIERWAVLKTLTKLINAAIKGTSTVYSSDQIEALKEVGLSSSLNFNFPTLNPYTDKADAIAKGIIDTYVAYKIVVGGAGLLSMDKLHSGNELLRRFFTVSRDGKEEKSPNLLMVGEGAKFEPKKLSSRTVLTRVDDIQRPLIEAFLGQGKMPAVKGLDDDDRQVLTGGWILLSADKRTSALTAILRKIEAAEDEILSDFIQPLAFVVGSTGAFPDEEVRGLDAEAFTAKTNLKLGKNEQEGTFFSVGDIHLAVYPEVREFTPGT